MFLRLLLLILFLAAPNMVTAQTLVSNGMAKAYYQNCVSRDDKRMSDSAQDLLCTCTAAKTQEKMSVEEIFAMKKEPGPGRIEYDKMLKEVYAPCMQFPIEETLYHECTNDREIKEFMLRDVSKLCRCTSKRAAEYVDAEGSYIMSYLLRNTPNIVDPLNYILGDSSFRKHAYQYLYSCLEE